MEPFENPDEGFETSSAKVVTGVRTQPELKMQLTNEAGECGMSTSEYCELLLLNRHDQKTEIELLALKVKEQQQEMETLRAQLATTGVKELEVLQEENAQLRKIIKEQTNQLSIYSDQRLLYLFDHLKGKKDTVENAYGENFAITYQKPEHIIQALIYSTKLNQ